MSDELIRAVLHVSATPWPPNHYDLLGLPVGSAEIGRMESHAIDRVERLRPYQLTRSDAVTDALNRLAQALACLSDPVAKNAYDLGLGISTATPVVESCAISGFQQASSPPPDTSSRCTPTRDVSRRDMIRRRVRLRSMRRSWDEMGLLLANADRPLASRSELVQLKLGVSAAARAVAVESVPISGLIGTPGALVLGLAREPFSATFLSELSPTYRRGLAGDWSRAKTIIQSDENRLHNRLRRSFWRRGRRIMRRMATVQIDGPLAVLGLLALILAGARTLW